MDRRFYRVKEMAEMTGVPEGTLYYLISQRKIPIVKLGRTDLIPAKFIDDLEEGRDGDSKDKRDKKDQG